MLETLPSRPPIIAVQRARQRGDKHFVRFKSLHPFERLQRILITLSRELLENRQINRLVHRQKVGRVRQELHRAIVPRLAGRFQHPLEHTASLFQRRLFQSEKRLAR